MNDWVLMIKDDEEKLVAPGNVGNHERAGWSVKPAPSEAPVVPAVAAADEVPLPEPTEEEAPKPRRRRNNPKKVG